METTFWNDVKITFKLFTLNILLIQKPWQMCNAKVNLVIINNYFKQIYYVINLSKYATNNTYTYLFMYCEIKKNLKKCTIA